ncbi:hybrid sensor histidine kinase/response regulator [Echinicola strongylocentroti]|uniref:histidine kinase n=1 Tax=Echinicola strongylocentroti TaxID=1795355 RepID=A0A2Z4IRR5_9BACT|nr:hybrid sensor histidine kinase/response regulator transcription factor [Echinicola strongylocentroti]AWW33266.1 hybrid sensor histidine kinase/response regulator [Echinicola strongylocentroti]
MRSFIKTAPLLLVCCAGILLQGFGQSQDYYFEHITMEEGLSGSTVFSILQDQQGFMWFGTKNGLNRYDGHNFKVFSPEARSGSGLGDNFIYGLFEDSRETIWVGTAHGLYTYNSSTEQFRHFDKVSNQGNQIDGTVGEITEDLDGNIYFAVNSRGLFRYNLKSDSLFQHQEISQTNVSVHDNNTTNVLVDEKGEVWVANSRLGVHKFLPESGKFQQYLSHPEVIKAAVLQMEDHGSNILLGTKDLGVWVMDKNSREVTPLLTKAPNGKNLFIRDLCKISDNELWIATESGLFIYDLEKNKFNHFTENLNDPYSISDNAVYCIERDIEGGMWVGTYFGGLNFLPNHPTKFKKHYPIPNSNTISGQRVREFEEGKNGTIWIGTEDAGLNHYDPKSDMYTVYLPNSSPESLSYHNVHGLARKDDELWVGTVTFAIGLNRINLNTNKIENFRIHSELNTPDDNEMHSLLVDNNKQVWLGTVVGLLKLNEEDNTVNFVNEIGNRFIYDMIEDHEGNLWLGTYSNGLIRYNPETGNIKTFRPDPNNPNSLPHNSIINIYEDSQNRIWIATEGGGFCIYNEKSDDFTVFNTDNGFPSNSIYKILEDISGHLWITCNRGLLEFNPQTTEYRLFTKDNGLMPYSFNYKSGYRAKDGTLYFGCLNGFISFDPREFEPYEYDPPVVITGIQVFNTPVPIGGEDPVLNASITKTSAITLNHNQSSLSFDFAALSYTASDALPYAYKMEGFDKNWTYLPQNQRINYSYLPPGDYTLKVKTADIFGEWSNREATLHITILPPFWKTNWAYILYAVLIILMMFLILKFYKDRIHRRQAAAFKRLEDEKQREVYQSKIEFFTNITHEIRTPLTLIKGPLESILKKEDSISPTVKESLWIMNKNTNRLIELSNELLDFRKTEKKGFTLNFTRSEIGKLLEGIYIRFKGSAEQQYINFHFIKREEPFFADIDREAFTKIISNLLSNAIKNAESTAQLEMVISLADAHFKVIVSNDGNLLSPENREKIFEPFFQVGGEPNKHNASGTGLGLPLARSLAEMHDGTLQVDPGNPKGRNTFILELPVKQKNTIKITASPIEDRDVDEQKKVQKQPKPSSSKGAVLIVEDNKELQKFIYDQLKEAYHIYRAENGQEGLQQLKEKPIDLVISDVMMPVMDGFTFCDILKSDVNFSHIPVIMLTAKNTLQSKIEGMEMGADVYLEKPFSMDHLSLQIKNLLHYRDQVRQAFANQPMVNVETIAHTRADEEFLFQANEAILENLDNESFGVNELADILCMSQSSLLRKIKGVSKMTPNGYIRLVRLKKAAEMLQKGHYTVTEISEKVGFNSPSYFSKCFQKQFGELPKDFSKGADTL